MKNVEDAVGEHHGLSEAARTLNKDPRFAQG
jgi:hypothetical protein